VLLLVAVLGVAATAAWYLWPREPDPSVATEAGVGPQALHIAALVEGNAEADVLEAAEAELDRRLREPKPGQAQGDPKPTAAGAPGTAKPPGPLVSLRDAAAAMADNRRIINALNVTLAEYRQAVVTDKGDLDKSIRYFKAVDVLLGRVIELLDDYLVANKEEYRPGLSASIGRTDDRIQQVLEQAENLSDTVDKAQNAADLIRSIGYLRKVTKAARTGLTQLKSQWVWADAELKRFTQRREVVKTKIAAIEESRLTIEIIRANAAAFDAVQITQPPRLELPSPAELRQ